MKIPRTLLAAALALSLAACGTDDPAANTGVAPTTDSPAAPASLATPAEAEVTGLVSSLPVSTEGATLLNDDCNLEGVDGRLFGAEALQLESQGKHEITGWIVDAKNKRIPGDLQLVIAGVGESSGTWLDSSPRWIDRAGVAETRGYDASLANSGFAFTVDTGAIGNGAYHVFVMSNEGGLSICDPGRQIRIGK